MQPAMQTETINGETKRAETAPSQPVLEHSIAETERKLAIENQEAEFKFNQRLAQLFAKSGCFQDIKKNISEEQALAQAFTKIELGKCMGFSPAESMQGVHLISGVPSVNAQLRAARMQRAGFHWDIDWFDNDKGFCEGCRLWLYRHGQPILKPVRNADGSPVMQDGRPVMEHVSVSFLKRDAEILMTKIWEGEKSRAASVLEKDNWKNTPRNMYFARAVTNAQRWHAPGVLSGEIPSTEEAQDFVDPDEQYKYGGSREAQLAVVKDKLAEFAMKKIAEEQQTNDTPRESPAEEQSGVSDAAVTGDVRDGQTLPPAEPVSAGSTGGKPQKPVFGRKL